MSQPRPSQSRTHSLGFSMVEVLVAIIILSLGVLGTVGMQASALRMNREVRLQATAGQLARELADKMRGNHVVAIKTTSTDNPYLLNLSPTTTLSAPTTNCYTGACTTGIDMARWDAFEWQTRLRNGLPSPRVVVCMDSTPFNSSGIPEWTCDNTGTVAMLKVSWNRSNSVGETEFTSTAASVPLLVLPLTAGSSQ